MPKKTKTTTNQETRLADPLRGAAKMGLQGAQDLYNDPQMANLPSAYVGMSDQRQQAYGNMQQDYNFGTAGQQGIDEWKKVMGGGYLDTANNPHLQDVVNRSVGAGQAQIGGVFGKGSRFGSGAFANSSMDAATATASRLYGAEYGRERQNMMAAMGQMGQVQALDERLLNPQMEEAKRLEYVGAQYETDEGKRLAEENRQHMWPYMQQQIYEASLSNSPLRQEGNANSVSVLKEPFDWAAMVSGMLSPPSIGGPS